VRRYCHLPHHPTAEGAGVDYSKDEAAREIEVLSGYTMPGSDMAHLPNLNDRDYRQRFLLSMQPIMRVMEERRRRNKEEAIRYTRCMVRKEDDHVGKVNGGVWKGYCYYDTHTGIHIPAKEYQRRYVAMIDASRRKCRRSLHHPEGEVVEEVGEKEHRYDDDAKSFANDNTRLATRGDSNDAIIAILNCNVGRRLPVQRQEVQNERNNRLP